MHYPGFDFAHAADLSRGVTYHGASLVGSSPALLSAVAPPWTYLLEFPIPDSADPQALYIVEIAADVVEGAASIATVGRDGVTLIDDRRLMSGERGSLSIVAGRARDCRGVIVRTVDEHPVRVRIDGLVWCCVSAGCDHFFSAPPRTELSPLPQWNRYYGPYGSGLERLRSNCYDALEQPRTMSWLFGLQIVIHPHEQISRAVFVSGLYEPATMLALRQFVPDGAYVIDAGANSGLITLACAVWCGPEGRVIAFEPSAREYARLLEHVRLNDARNVQVHRMALGSSVSAGHLRVAESQYSGLNTLASRFAYEGVAVARTEAVDVTTLDAIVASVEPQRLDAIKMDVEGAEIGVLRGGVDTIRRFRPVLLMEAADSALAAHGETMDHLAQTIDALEYDPFRIEEDGALTAVRSVDGTVENFVALPRERRGILFRPTL